jgi:3-oxoacyl-[acyl-carrier protein] reductase
MELRGKAAIVTGSGTGVGRSTALALAAQGCDVVVNYSRSEEAAKQVAALARDAGVRSIAVKADVSDDEQCRSMVGDAQDAFGRLDILVNNAGTTSFVTHSDLEAMTSDAWDRILGVNLKGPFFMARAAEAALKADGGGHIVNVSSVAGVYGTGSSIAYCASKAGLNNLTVTLARVMGPEVQVNTVCPGFIDGEWLRGGMGENFESIKSRVEGTSMLNAVCTPDDVRDAIVAFITGSRLVTAQIMVVDGGSSQRM